MDRSFIKMHGLGNDFVVLDARKGAIPIGAVQARAIADRRTGIGCDQVIVIDRPLAGSSADVFMRILNADGSETSACGNATRCIAHLLMDESGRDHVIIETKAGKLDAVAAADELVTIDMGPARTEWQDVPLARACDTLHAPISMGELEDPACTSMGNPHATFFVSDVESVPMHEVGPQLERHPMFPERANIGVAEVQARDLIRLRVWERGAGLTLACGTGACAALVSGVRRGLTDRRATLVLDGGELTIEWRESDGHVLMTGPAAVSFRGHLPAELVE